MLAPPSSARAAIELLEAGGGSVYHGEAVTQLEHALQCASCAQRAGADDELTLAALLHDVGHLLGDEADEEIGVVAHDATGAAWLRELGFSERLVALVAGHVDAKRYLVATNPDYFARLSETSLRTLELQGGPMSADEARAFESDPFFRDKLRLRSWDEQAKIPGAEVPPLRTYYGALARGLAGAR